jgi:hypothetical protein
VFELVVAGVLVSAISTFAKWLKTESDAPHGRHLKELSQLALWFDTYQIDPSTDTALTALAGLQGINRIAECISDNNVQACIHELVAVRLTAAPEADVEKIRNNLRQTIELDSEMEIDDKLIDALFSYYDGKICDIVGELAGAQPALFAVARQDAFSARIVAVLSSIEMHAVALSGAISLQDRRNFIANYQRHVVDLHGKIQPPDFERRQRVPLDDIYVSPTIIELPSGRAMASSVKRTSRKFRHGLDGSGDPQTVTLAQLSAKIDRTVLLGDPGGGKSTASHWLMYEFAKHATQPTPFLVILREFRSDDAERRSIVGYIEHNLDVLYQCEPPAGLVRQLLLSGVALVVFDGLDELLDGAMRAEVTEMVEQFGVEYPQAKIIVTSRVIGYDEARLDDTQYKCYRLSGFDDAQVRDYVEKWFAQDDTIRSDEARKWSESFMGESASVADLRSNPLLLALMCILYNGTGSIPYNRPAIYEQCAELMLRKWDMRRRIKIELRAPNLLEPVLRHIAFWLFTKPGGNVTASEPDLKDELARFLLERGFGSEEDAGQLAGEFIGFCSGRAWVFSDAGTTDKGVRLYRFTHRTFLEYFAAAHLAITSDTPEALGRRLIGRIAKKEWAVVAELAVQKKDQINDCGAERVVRWMLASKIIKAETSRANVLEFIGRCMESLELPQRLIREIVHTCFTYYYATDNADPVMVAMQLGGDRHDLVVAEFTSELESAIECNDFGIVLRWFEAVFSRHLRNDVDLLNRGSVMRSWLAYSREIVGIHADVFVDVMKSDPYVMRCAISDGIVHLGDLMSADPVFLAQLWAEAPAAYLTTGYMGYFPWLAARAVGDAKKHGGIADFIVEHLTEAGAVLGSRLSPPWFSFVDADGPDAWKVRIDLAGLNDWVPAGEEVEVIELLSGGALLGFMVILMMAEELEEWLGGSDALVFARKIRYVGLYVEMRRLKVESSLPDLGLPDAMMRVVREWASGQISLIQITNK